MSDGACLYSLRIYWSIEPYELGLLRCRFEDLLRALTVERADIREAMVFALDNADCAAEVRGCQLRSS